VDVLLAVVAVVAEVEDLVVGQGPHRPLGVGLLGDMHPQRRAALAGVAEVLLDGVGVVGDGAGDALGRLRSAWNRSQLSRICWLV
jgi:hypothetical protein